MKTVLLNIVIAVGALVLLAGCAKDGDGTRPEGKITAITVSAGGFSPVAGVRSGDTAMAANAAAASVATEDVGTVYARASEGSNHMGTRATDEGYITGFDSGDKIGLTVVKSDGTIVHNNIVLTYDGSGWNLPAETDLWFYTGAQYVACYPYDAAMTAVIEAADDKTGTGIAAAIFAAFTPKSDQSAYADYTASDLMLWSGSANTTGVSPKLDIALKHAMAMVIHEPHGAGYTTPAGVAWEWHEAATYSSPSDIAVTVNGTGYIPYAMLDAGNSTTAGVSGAPDGTYRFLVKPGTGIDIAGEYKTIGTIVNWSNGSTGTKDLTAGEYLKYNIDPPAAMPSGEGTPEIGDYFYQGDGTGIPDRFLPAGMMTGTLATDCLGVVFWVDPQNAASGMVVSKDEVDLPWRVNTVSMPAGYSDKLNYGKANTELVMNIPNAENLYPAFAWCAGKGPGWYFPSSTEMNLIWNAWARGTIDRPNPPLSLQQSAIHIAAFNEKLTKISGKEFIEDKIYSSSTLGPLSGIQTVTFSVPVPSQAGGGFSETTACPVRAVRTY